MASLRVVPGADATLLVKRDGLYESASVTFDMDRGKVWIHLSGEDTGLTAETLCVEAPRLRALLAAYELALGASGLPPITEDGRGPGPASRSDRGRVRGIRESLRWFLDRGGRISLDAKLVLRVGDLAYLANRWSLTGGTMPDGSPAELGATTAEVARLQPDGTWLYVIDNAWGDLAA
jgi:hypothetical protein